MSSYITAYYNVIIMLLVVTIVRPLQRALNKLASGCIVKSRAGIKFLKPPLQVGDKWCVSVMGAQNIFIF